MQGQLNPKIVGSTIIGFALVFGAYTISSLTSPKQVSQPAAPAASVTTPPRVAIAVTDIDGNGIEDWRDEFVIADPVIINTTASDYTLPDTLTGQTSIDFMKNVLSARQYGPFGSANDEIIDNTIGHLTKETETKFYDVADIDIMQTWDDNDIVNYANTVAATLYRHNVASDGELEILYDVLVNENEDRISELSTIAGVYRNYRDDTLQIPVPRFLAKEHLDLINTYHAILVDIEAMASVFEDPAVSLLRLKRYQDDAAGLSYALQNMYLALEPHASLFTIDDPAALFVVFSPDFQY